jgi:hypothetical protein
MKGRYRVLLLAAGLGFAAVWWHARIPEPTLLSFRPGQAFEGVVKDSTYPVMNRSNLPSESETGWGATWVTEPAVVVRLNDSEHGFVLPPTKFAALSYQQNVVASLATSPMLEELPFDEAVAVLENLQNQFKAGGWKPWTNDDSVWFDLTPEGRKRLYARMFEPGYAQEASLRIPKLYGMVFRLKCTEGCWTREPPYRFLIDVGVGRDVFGWERGDPAISDPSHPAASRKGMK